MYIFCILLFSLYLYASSVSLIRYHPFPSFFSYFFPFPLPHPGLTPSLSHFPSFLRHSFSLTFHPFVLLRFFLSLILPSLSLPLSVLSPSSSLNPSSLSSLPPYLNPSIHPLPHHLLPYLFSLPYFFPPPFLPLPLLPIPSLPSPSSLLYCRPPRRVKTPHQQSPEVAGGRKF